MTWTYDGNPADNTKDEVRFLVGDTNSADRLVEDEEINYALAKESVYNAAATVSNAIAAKFAREADFSVDGLSKSLSQRAEHYKTLAKELRAKASTKAVTPYAGGISISDKESVDSDSDRVAPRFYRDQFDYDKNRDNDQDSD